MGNLEKEEIDMTESVVVWIAVAACCLLGVVTRNARKK